MAKIPAIRDLRKCINTLNPQLWHCMHVILKRTMWQERDENVEKKKKN